MVLQYLLCRNYLRSDRYVFCTSLFSSISAQKQQRSGNVSHKYSILKGSKQKRHHLIWKGKRKPPSTPTHTGGPWILVSGMPHSKSMMITQITGKGNIWVSISGECPITQPYQQGSCGRGCHPFAMILLIVLSPPQCTLSPTLL